MSSHSQPCFLPGRREKTWRRRIEEVDLFCLQFVFAFYRWTIPTRCLLLCRKLSVSNITRVGQPWPESRSWYRMMLLYVFHMYLIIIQLLHSILFLWLRVHDYDGAMLCFQPISFLQPQVSLFQPQGLRLYVHLVFVFNLACFVSLCVHSLCGSWALVAVVCLLYALCVLEPLSVMERHRQKLNLKTSS